jgi:predicted nicotinamide N-methyase
MADRQSDEGKATIGYKEPSIVSRRRLLTLGVWALLPAIATALTSCSAPQYDPERGLFVMRPKK